MEIKNPSVEPVIPERAHWNNKIEFVLACLSLSVGLGNVWRFPYLAYSNGGGAFLLPYILVLVLCGKPMYFMEVAFGQYNQEGPVTIWKKVSPIGRGVGVAQVIIQIMTAMYYIIIMAWTMYYFWTTLIAACQSRPVPWGAEFCSSEWAHKETCLELRGTTDLTSSDLPIVEFGDYSPEDGRRKESSAQQYFDRVVLMKYDKGGDRSYGLDNMGAVNWLLMASLAGCWVLMFFSLVKGISSAGKVSDA